MYNGCYVTEAMKSRIAAGDSEAGTSGEENTGFSSVLREYRRSAESLEWSSVIIQIENLFGMGGHAPVEVWSPLRPNANRAGRKEMAHGRIDKVAVDALRDYSLEGKTALVTGAAGGIGSAITERLCGLGARVVLADVVDRVESAAEEWARKGYQTSAVKLDVTDSAEVEKAASALNKEFGAVDILVANAGVAYEAPTATHSDEDWQRCLKINLDGVFYCVRSFGKRMVERKAGSIVCISSIAGVKAVRPELHAGYDVSKAGVAHLCRVVGVEWATHNVRVNAVGPGYTETDMLKKVGLEQPAVMKAWIDDIPMKRLLQPSEIAATIGFLVSDAASGITGQLIMTDAGYSAA